MVLTEREMREARKAAEESGADPDEVVKQVEKNKRRAQKKARELSKKSGPNRLQVDY